MVLFLFRNCYFWGRGGEYI